MRVERSLTTPIVLILAVVSVTGVSLVLGYHHVGVDIVVSHVGHAVFDMTK